MEKIIEINGKKVGLKASAKFLLLYENYFGKDGLKDLNSLLTGAGTANDLENAIIIYRITWAMAKNYNKKIAPLEDWLDEFDSFNLADVITELLPLIKSAFGASDNDEKEPTENNKKN